MTTKDLASKLNGIRYADPIPPELIQVAKEYELAIVMGASDDLIEFYGCINEDKYCFDGGTVYVNNKGLVTNECDKEDCPYAKKEKENSIPVKAAWGDTISWTYETAIPHEKFNVIDELDAEDIYCVGMVFSMTDVKKMLGAVQNE